MTPPQLHLHLTVGAPSVESWNLLTRDEQARGNRFHFPRDQHRWINGRAFVRQTLSGLLGISAARLRMEAWEGGKLHLPDHPELGFNLSHSGDWVVLATASGCDVGVDIEKLDSTFPAIEIADEFFLPTERKWMGTGKDPTLRFFQLWTAKEALMKATGEGMFLPPDKILITPGGGTVGGSQGVNVSLPAGAGGSGGSGLDGNGGIRANPGEDAGSFCVRDTATDLRSGRVYEVLRGLDLGVAAPGGMALAVVCRRSE